MASKEAVKREIKQERAARTREEILEAAIKLFARRGFLATTMAELAKAIRMTPGALYWHFPTKEDLLLAAIEELHQRYMKEFVDLVSEGRKLTAKQQLIGFMERTQNFLRYHREYGIFFGMVAAESADSHERVAGALRDALGTYAQALAGIIKYGQQKTGEFRKEVDAQTIAQSLMGAHMGLIVYNNLFREQTQYDPLMNALDMLVVDGIAAKPS
jgi:AcrR family transcriptional regulator